MPESLIQPGSLIQLEAVTKVFVTDEVETHALSNVNVQIEREGFETVGGFLLTRLGRVPAVGERFVLDGLDVEVLEVERRRIRRRDVGRILDTHEHLRPQSGGRVRQ